jgi:hypothetical protein
MTTDARLDELVTALNAIEGLDPDACSISDLREEFLLDQPEFDVDRSTDYTTADRPGTWYTHDGAQVFPTNDGWAWSR